MTAVHNHTIRLPVLPSGIQSANNGFHVALPHSRGAVRVWNIQDISCKPLELVGHRKPVYGLAFGHRHEPTVLCSAAEDYVIVWNVERARLCSDTGQQIRGTVIGKTLGCIQYVSVNYDDTMVAVCAESNVYILDATQNRVDTILEGHTALVNCAEFCPQYSATLVTASEDRTFKVWNLSNGSLVYQSTIISSSPFISLAMDPTQNKFALGTSDGQVRVYDLTDGNGFRCLNQLDVGKMCRKIQEARQIISVNTSPAAKEKTGPVTISSKPSWQRNDPGPVSPGGEELDEDDVEVGCSILALLYTQTTTDQGRSQSPSDIPSFLRENTTLVNDLLSEARNMLMIGTTTGLLRLDAKTSEPMQYINFKDPIISSMNNDDSVTISLSGSMALSDRGSTNKTSAVVGSLFSYDVHIVHVFEPTSADTGILRSQLAQAKKISQGAGTTGNGQDAVDPLTSAVGASSLCHNDLAALTVLSSAPLVSNSPLKAELVMKSKDSKMQSKTSPPKGSVTKLGGLDKKGKIVDQQPIIYHEKIKSSGYTNEKPRKTMFQPKTNVQQAVKLSSKPSKSASTKSVVKEYPMESDPPTLMVRKLEVADRPTAINTVQFSGDGQSLACALANTSMQVFKMPLTGKGAACTGHAGSVTCSNWSRDGKWIVTSSDDKTASIWSPGIPDPVMNFKLQNNNFGADKEGGLKPDKDNTVFTNAVKFTQFYYMDKFLLLTCGNSFSLYKYILDASKSDLKRYLSNNRYKLVKSFQMSDSQQITAFSAVNSFYSYLAFCSGTNKAVEVFDLNVCRSVRVIPDAHTRAPHVICQNQGSAYVSHSSSAYDLFVTAAATDCIKLWDLRSNRCVCRYEGHSNRSQPCGLAISPCSRFIATGSEDRSAYIFDIRSGTYLHKLTGHTDTVSDVAFHPLYPQLLTATLDGKLKLFANK